MRSHFKQFDVLVGDYLHRHNVQFLDGLPGSQAVHHAMADGKQIMTLIREILDANDCRDVRLISSYSFYNEVSFRSRIDRFKSMIAADPHFRSLLEFAIKVFLQRKAPALLDSKAGYEHSLAYQLEELAMFELLAERGYTVNVYPGSQLPVMKSFVTGELPGVSRELEQLTLVELKLRPTP